MSMGIDARYSEHVLRVKNIVLSCDGMFVGECVGLILNSQYDDLSELKVVISDQNKGILISVLQMDYSLTETNDRYEHVIYPKDDQNEPWDCLHVYIYPSTAVALRGSMFDIDYVSMSSKSISCIDGSYYMKFQKNGIQKILDRMHEKRFCMAYPHKNSSVIMRAMSLVSKGWSMDDSLLPGKSLILRIQQIDVVSCDKCNLCLQINDTVTTVNEQHYCMLCVSKR